MKKTVIWVLVSIALVGNTATVHAGFFDKLAERVGESVANTVSDKIVGKASESAGKATDSMMNDTTQPTDQQASQNTSVPSLGGLGGMMAAIQKPVSIDDSYTFSLGVRTELTGDGRNQVITQSMSDNAFYIEPSSGQGMIMDFNNRAMIMLDEKRKTKTAMSTDLLQQFGGAMGSMGGSTASSQSVSSISNTGQTKDILGYTAQLWVYQDAQSRGEVWVSSDLSFDMIGMSKKMVGLFGDRASGNLPLDFSKTSGDIHRGKNQ